jgi:hypothetical protein
MSWILITWCLHLLFTDFTLGQESVDASEGINVAMHGLVSLAVCFSILLCATLLINFVYYRLVRKMAARGRSMLLEN